MTESVTQEDYKTPDVAYYMQNTEKWSFQSEYKMHMGHHTALNVSDWQCLDPVLILTANYMQNTEKWSFQREYKMHMGHHTALNESDWQCLDPVLILTAMH
jgi:hypothetical protein